MNREETATRLIDRFRLKSKISLWRSLFLVSLFILAITSLQDSSDLIFKGDSVARIEIKGVIGDNLEEQKELQELLVSVRDDKKVKALVLDIDSPGGSLVGSEAIYNLTREISAVKPVVAVLNSVAASGGYMVALAADYIVAHTGTITGSIGVVMQYFNVNKLAEKVGIGLKTYKSSKFKAAPSPFEYPDQEIDEVVQSLIGEGYNYFVGLVAKRRPLSMAEVLAISDGRVYLGSTALQLNMIDQIGGESEVTKWLATRNVTAKIKDAKSAKKSPASKLKRLYSRIMSLPEGNSNNGLMAIWRP